MAEPTSLWDTINLVVAGPAVVLVSGALGWAIKGSIDSRRTRALEELKNELLKNAEVEKSRLLAKNDRLQANLDRERVKMSFAHQLAAKEEFDAYKRIVAELGELNYRLLHTHAAILSPPEGLNIEAAIHDVINRGWQLVNTCACLRPFISPEVYEEISSAARESTKIVAKRLNRDEEARALERVLSTLDRISPMIRSRLAAMLDLPEATQASIAQPPQPHPHTHAK